MKYCRQEFESSEEFLALKRVYVHLKALRNSLGVKVASYFIKKMVYSCYQVLRKGDSTTFGI